MPEMNKNRLFADKNGGVKMRLYGQGLGDCFLFAFPRNGDATGENPCYFVIDCGAASSTPGGAGRINQVVENIRDATGGRIDALALTHQHFDHISSFYDAQEAWRQITVENLYLPWTEENAVVGEVKGVNQFREILKKAAEKALDKAAGLGMLDAQPGFRAQADFLGVSLAADATADAPKKGRKKMDEAMKFARGLCLANTHYFKPGDVFRLPGTDFHGYVLGPPLGDNVRTDKNGKETKYIELLVDDDPAIMYSYVPPPLNMTVDDGKPGGANAIGLSDDRSLPALASGLLAADSLADAGYRDADEGFCPFAPEIRLDWDNAMSSHFFQEHYGAREKRGQQGVWRRVDNDWLVGASSLALRAGDFTNNISLVLAFDMPHSEKMLLFPGDAQVGNWLSWHTIKAWKPLDDANLDNAPQPDDDRKQTLMENLLSRVAFYKVGHHGSHNATIRAQGLELMTHPDLMAFIPVSVPVAQDYMGYCPMPFYPVVRALQAQTKGRVFLPNGHCVGDPPGDLPESVKKSTELDSALSIAPILADDGTTIEGEVPLYLEVTIAP